MVEYFNVNWTINNKNHGILFFKILILILAKFQCILLLKSSFDGGLLLNFYFDITITYFLIPRFSFHLHDKHIVINSKVNYECTLFLELINIFRYDFD